MRIVQLGPYPPPHGGVQSNLVSIRSYLRKRNVPCTVINITRHRKIDGDDVYYPKSVIELIRLLFRLKFDVLHLHLGGRLTNRLLALGAVCCSLRRTRTVLTFHSGGYPSSHEGKMARPFSLGGFVFRRFDRLIGVNSEIVDFFKCLGVREDRIRLIYPHAFFEQDESVEIPQRVQRFIQEHPQLFVSVGLLEREYDLPLQIEVMKSLREELPHSGLLLIGSGSLEQELRAKIMAKPYAQHVMLCGDMPHGVTMKIIDHATAMLRTTLYDGDAVSVREALYLGTPVIASDNGMRPSGVKLIRKEDIGSLRTAIMDVVKSEKTGKNPPVPDESNLEEIFKLYRELVAD